MDYELLTNGKVQIGDEASNFKTNSSMGEISLSKNNEWHVLFSYKEDFYPIATSEFINIQKNIKDFEMLNAKIIAMSTGNLLSHIAWLEDIHRNTGIKITFPLIEDPIGEICRKFGMISKINGENMVMSNIVLIDDLNIIRVILQYSPNIERNIYEILRIIRLSK